MLNGGISQFVRKVPFCPCLSSFVPICPRSGPQSLHKRTNGDKTGLFGTNWETPPFSIRPHSALLKKGVVYKSHAGWFINHTPGEFINQNVLIKFGGFHCRNSIVYRKRGKFNTNFLAARQFISPTQRPWLSAASEGLQNRKKYNTSNIYTVKRAGKFQVTVCSVTVCPFSLHKGNQRPKCL